jgi:hypothetical protein
VISHFFESFFQRVVRNWHDLPRLCAPNFPSFNLPNPFKRKTATIKKKAKWFNVNFFFFFFFTFRTGNIRREYMSKKRKIPNWDSYCSTNVNKSRVCWHKELHATRFLLIEVKRREKNKKKRRREFTRLQSAQQSALVSAGVNDRRETGDLSCRLRAPVGGRNAFSEDAQKFPAWLLLLCCFAAAAAAHQFSWAG